MTKVKGTTGYEEVVEKYIEATNQIPFEVLHKDFLKFIPNKNSLILDIGAGSGRDSFELTKKGHSVIAVEPLKEFRVA